MSEYLVDFPAKAQIVQIEKQQIEREVMLFMTHNLKFTVWEGVHPKTVFKHWKCAYYAKESVNFA